MRLSIPFALALASVSLLACGGKVVFTEDEGTGGAGGSTGIGAEQTTGAGASGAGASEPGTSGSGTSGSGTSGSGTSGSGTSGSGTSGTGSAASGSTTGSGSATTGPTSGSSTGSGTGVVDPTIACGNQTCDGTTEACCLTMQGQSCIPAGGNCQGPKLDCSKTANCAPGEVCCFEGGPGGGASCRDTCGGGGPGSGVQLCETDAECLNGEPCTVGKGGIKRCDGFGPGGG